MAETGKNLTADILALGTFKELINAYEEIAASNMRRIRNTVLAKRDFLSELATIYHEVRSTYKKEVSRLLLARKIKDLSQFPLLQKNDKTLCIFFSSNANFYGDIVASTYALFKEYLVKEQAEPVVIGKVGKNLFVQENPGLEFTYFDFPDDRIDPEQLRKIVLHIAAYERVFIFHPKFESLLRQIPVAFAISESDQRVAANNVDVRYIFEPSLDKIMQFFEEEIFGSLFEQAVYESQLAKFAARMTTLDEASENIKRRLKSLSFRKRQISYRLRDKQQLNAISGLVALKKR